MTERRRPDVEIVQLVRVSYLMGAGAAPHDPVRRVDAYFDLNGMLVCEVDPWPHNDVETLELRLAAARDALVRTGYFREDEVGPDVAPRIIELWSAMNLAGLRNDDGSTQPVDVIP